MSKKSKSNANDGDPGDDDLPLAGGSGDEGGEGGDDEGAGDEGESGGEGKGKGKKKSPAVTAALAALVAICSKITKDWRPFTRAWSVVLFGRFMPATAKGRATEVSAAFKTDGAACVSHGFSVDRANVVSDWFSAQDDLCSTGEAAHLSENELASYTIYRYLTIDVNMAERGLGRSDTADALAAFLRCALEAESKARQTSMAAKTRTFFALAALRASPANLAGAFERPVTAQESGGSGMSISELAVARIGVEWQSLERVYAGDSVASFTPEAAAAYCVSSKPLDELAPSLAQYEVQSQAEFVERIRKAVLAGVSADGAGRVGGRFLDLYCLRFVPGACQNRDDKNQCKTMDVGGFLRIRESSQCWKRQIRMLMHKDYTGSRGFRAKRLVGEIMKRLGGGDDPVHKLVVSHMFEAAFSKNVSVSVASDPVSMVKDPSEPSLTNGLVFLGENEIDALVGILRASWAELEPVGVAAYNDLQAILAKESQAEGEKKSRGKGKSKGKSKGKGDEASQ